MPQQHGDPLAQKAVATTRTVDGFEYDDAETTEQFYGHSQNVGRRIRTETAHRRLTHANVAVSRTRDPAPGAFEVDCEHALLFDWNVAGARELEGKIGIGHRTNHDARHCVALAVETGEQRHGLVIDGFEYPDAASLGERRIDAGKPSDPTGDFNLIGAQRRKGARMFD